MSAERHNSRESSKLLDPSNTGGGVWTDTSYRSYDIEELLADSSYRRWGEFAVLDRGTARVGVVQLERYLGPCGGHRSLRFRADDNQSATIRAVDILTATLWQSFVRRSHLDPRDPLFL